MNSEIVSPKIIQIDHNQIYRDVAANSFGILLAFSIVTFVLYHVLKSPCGKLFDKLIEFLDSFIKTNKILVDRSEEQGEAIQEIKESLAKFSNSHERVTSAIADAIEGLRRNG